MKWFVDPTRFRYPEEYRKQIETVHQSRPDVWDRIMSDPTYTEDEFWENIFTNRTNDLVPISNLLVVPIKITEPVSELKQMLSDSLKVDPDIFNYLRSIRSSGLQLGILSNHSRYWMSIFVNKYGLVPTFDSEMIINSQDVACRKPDPKIYEILINRVNAHISTDITPSQIIFIGISLPIQFNLKTDDKPANVDAAQKMGLKSFVFNRKIHEPSQFATSLATFGINL